MAYSILFLGDVVGKPGRMSLRHFLPGLQDAYEPLFTVVNGENAAGGVGITPDNAEEIFGCGVDAITLGNHAFSKRDIYPYLNTGRPIVRPANMPLGVPGMGVLEIEKAGIRLAILNMCGRVFMDSYDDPFRTVDCLLKGIDTPHRILDFHAEATSEKVAMGWHLAGRVTAVLGTHTHIPTADEAILPGGTAYITDVGMTGPDASVIGMDRHIVLERFRTTLPIRFEVANEPGVISGVVLNVEQETGRALSIERIRAGEGACGMERI